MAQAKVVIQGYDNLKGPLQQAQNELNTFSQVASQVGDTLKKAFTVGAIVGAIKAIGDAMSDCLNAFNEADREYKQLALSLSDTTSFTKVSDTIKQLSRQTLSSKDDIESMVSELAALGRSSDEIDEISRAAVYLSNVTGKDLNSSMTTLLNTYNGNTKQLQKLGIDTANFTKEELAEGAAIQVVIDKFGALSEAMAKNDTAQTIKNIKDSLGDMKQSVGDLVNVIVGPALQQIDGALLTIKGKFDTFIQNAKIVIQNFPEVMSHLWEAIKKGLEQLFSYEGIKTFFSNIMNLQKTMFTSMANNAANLMEGINGLVERLWDGIKNYSMYMITKICDDVGINISEIVNQIGEWLITSPIGKVIDQILSKLINGIKLVGNIIKNIPSIVKIVVNNIGTILSTLFQNIPKAIGQIFVGLGNKVAWFAVKLKNDIAQAIEDVINGIGEKISSTWLGRWLGLGNGMRDFDIGVDRSTEYRLAGNADVAFSNAKNYMGNIGEDLAPMFKEIESLLNPAFEKWTADNATTLGQTMATWTAKSSDEYYKAAKSSFKDIGTFLKDWGATFLGDLQDGWGETASAFTQIFEDSFGGSFDEFLEWFRPFMENKMLEAAAGKSSLNIGVTVPNGSGDGSDSSTANKSFLDKLGENIGSYVSDKLGATSEQGAAAGSAVVSDFTSQMGEAGEVVSRLATNMAAMGPLLGAIVTALHYVIGGIMETLKDVFNDFIQWGIEPLKEFGRMIGEILLPIFKEIMPSVIASGQALMKLFQALAKAIAPIIELIMKVLGPILTVLADVVVAIVGTIAWAIEGLKYAVTWVLNKITFGAVSVSENPGSLSDYVSNMMVTPGEGYETVSADSTGVTNASYSGGTVIHLNVINNGVVCGDSGIQEFSIMIRDNLLAAGWNGR